MARGFFALFLERRVLIAGAILSFSSQWACSSDAEGPAGSGAGGSPASGGLAPGGGAPPRGGGAPGGGGGGAGGGGGGGGLPDGGDVAPTGGATGSGGGEGGGFEPCPETGPCKVLPLGDSITVGLGFDGGYRVELFRLALENGHEITFLGSQQPNGPQMVAGTPFPRQHEGISGQTITQIADRIPQPGLNEMPHIILLHAGTNDMVQGAAGATDRLASLIDLLIEEAPDALIVVSNIIPLPFAADAVNAFNAPIPGLVQSRAEAGAHVVFVDQFEGFPVSELGDNVHPDENGYNRMAAKWFAAIAEYLR